MNDPVQEGDQLRIDAYADKYLSLKENNASQDFLEREMLLEFVKVNQGHFSDLSENFLQQTSIVNIICLRSFKFERFKYIQNIIQGFTADVARYASLAPGEEEDFDDKRAGAVNRLLVSDDLLAKLVQAVIRVQAVILNAFEEIIISIFGKRVEGVYREICDRVEFSAAFWRTTIDTFIRKVTDKAYERIVAKSRFSYSRTKTTVVLNFPFDNILTEIKREELQWQRHKDQSYYVETNVHEFELKRIKQIVSEHMASTKHLFLPDTASSEELTQVTAIVCLDQAALDYKRLAVDEVLDDMNWEEVSKLPMNKLALKESLDQVKEQLLASALGAAMAYDTISKDFNAAVNVFSVKNMSIFQPDELETIFSSIRLFTPSAIYNTYMYMLEAYFMNLLKRKSADKKDKIDIRKTHRRRITEDMLDELYSIGLSRIQKNKLFRPDNTSPGMLEFVCLSKETLKQGFGLLQIEPYVQEKLLEAWANAGFKIDFFVIIKLGAILRSTPDLKRGLAEILYKYGIMAA